MQPLWVCFWAVQCGSLCVTRIRNFLKAKGGNLTSPECRSTGGATWVPLRDPAGNHMFVGCCIFGRRCTCFGEATLVQLHLAEKQIPALECELNLSTPPKGQRGSVNGSIKAPMPQHSLRVSHCCQCLPSSTCSKAVVAVVVPASGVCVCGGSVAFCAALAGCAYAFVPAVGARSDGRGATLLCGACLAGQHL